MVYVASRKAAAMLGLHPQTLRRYANEGKIPHYRNSAGQRLYDVDAYLRGASRANIVCYCRVSSAQQRGDLGRQVAQMRELYPDAEIVTDVAGGNCSDLRGSEQLAAGGERVQASCAPGAEDRCQRHLALGTTFRPGAPADLAADNHMAQAALGGVVVRRHVRFGHEDEEFLDVALDAPAQPALQS